MKKIICAVLLIGITIASSLSIASAGNIEGIVVTNPTASSDTTITIMADTIVTKFRIYNGLTQYRRWNATKGVWVDPYWITVK